MGAPTQAEIEDFANRNVNADGSKDYHRAVEALTNYTGDREFDSQGPMYDQRTNQLSPAGVQATAQLRQRQAASARPGSLASLLQPNAGQSGGVNLSTGSMYDKHAGGPMNPMPMPSTPTNWWDIEGGLPPGVPPGSVRTNGGINPNVWAYITPDGRRVSGTYQDSGISGPYGQPVSTTMPVGGRSQLSSLL